MFKKVGKVGVYLCSMIVLFASWAIAGTQHVSVVRYPLQDEIATKIHETNLLEIEIGRLAAEKGTTSKVRSYGNLLVRDHQFADKRLMKVAQQAGIRLPSLVYKTPGETLQEAENQVLLDQLRAENGTQFDQTFYKAMAKGHQEAIQNLSQAQESLSPQSSLRSYIAETLPILGQHEQLAQSFERGPKS